MGKQLVADGGFLVLAPVGGPVLFDGLTLQHASLTRTIQTADSTASGDGYRSELPIRRGYELAATAYADVAHGLLFALGDICTALYQTQSGAVLFWGNALVVHVADTQQQGGYEMQEIALRSTGTPTVG
ncbi:MAG: hypothetical protein HYU66_05500 [Armatimonadetes bacterium]|nr:hypothetical protein [Armatimonadota bacterium]